MSDERSERLRRNRNRAKERVQRSAPPADSRQDESSQPSKQEPAEQAEEDSESSVKDERVGTYMYLPEAQQKELSRLYNVLKAEYEYEYDLEFEKNRHFYPLVIEFGKTRLDGLEASDIKSKLDSLDLDPGPSRSDS